uniref:Uncharacterized protein n=1 Tax=Panagrolaimus davidi TaxID=227884 RepID=A0A914QGX6_9BILA
MWRINHENREEQSISEDVIPESLSSPNSSISTDNFLISMNRLFEDNEDLLTKCNRIAQRISEEFVQKRITYKSATLSQFKNIVLWLRVRIASEYETEEELLNEYQYLFYQVKKFDFKNFNYLHIHSAVYHLYNHFDEMINCKCFANYKRTLDLKIFDESENIIGELIKTRNHTKLLNDCLNVYFNLIPTQLFKSENLVYWQSTDCYEAFNYTTFEIVGSQVKFSPNGPLSIATIYACRDQDDVDLGDGTAIDFQKQ